jgi:hypothetical protein
MAHPWKPNVFIMTMHDSDPSSAFASFVNLAASCVDRTLFGIRCGCSSR